MRRRRTGLPGGGRSAPPRGPDPEAIRRIPEITGPEADTTADAGELSEIYDDLGSRIGTRAEEREITVAFAGGAVLLLRLAIGASLRGSGASSERRHVLRPMPVAATRPASAMPRPLIQN